MSEFLFILFSLCTPHSVISVTGPWGFNEKERHALVSCWRRGRDKANEFLPQQRPCDRKFDVHVNSQLNSTIILEPLNGKPSAARNRRERGGDARLAITSGNGDYSSNAASLPITNASSGLNVRRTAVSVAFRTIGCSFHVPINS